MGDSSFNDFYSEFIRLATDLEYNTLLKCSSASFGIMYNTRDSGPITWDQTTKHNPCYEKTFA